MKILDFFANQSFKKDEAGNELFFPWGVLGKGYIVDGAETKQKLRESLRFYYGVSFAILIVWMIFINPFIASRTLNSNLGGPSIEKIISYFLAELPLFIVLAILMAAWYYLSIKPIIKTLKPTTAKMGWRESYERYAKTIHPAVLWFGLIGSVGFVLSALWLLFQRPESIFVGILTILFFGPIGFLDAYMISLRNKS